MIATKLTAIGLCGGMTVEAARTAGIFGACITISISAAFVFIAEHRPTRRWVFDRLGSKRTSDDRNS